MDDRTAPKVEPPRFSIDTDGVYGTAGYILDAARPHRCFCVCDTDQVEFVCAALNAAHEREKESEL